jgi:heme-degrading monooxygenase HmoA
MYARVMTSEPKPDSVEAAIAEWPHHISAFKGKGLTAGYLFFDRASNKFLSITIWESEEAQRRNAVSREADSGASTIHEASDWRPDSERARSLGN